MRLVRSMVWLLLGGAFVGFTAVGAEVGDPSLDTGRHFAPFTLTLQPSLQMNPLPGWMKSPAVVQKETATVEVPLPPLWLSPVAEMYAVTIVFDDCGDGGPALEWRAPNGTNSVVAQGLGELGARLGLNSRTIMLPQELTREGGILLISYYAQFEKLLSISLRPARRDALAVLGGQSDPVMVDEALRVFRRGEVDGLRNPPLSGDVRRGTIVEAELSAEVQELEGELEFVMPMEGVVEGAMLKLEVLGLDPEATLEVVVNSHSLGPLAAAPFALDDPSLVTDEAGRLVLAGWRGGSLFIPARRWMAGDNSIVIRLKRSEEESGRRVFLRNAALHVRFGSEPIERPVAEPTEPDFDLPDPFIPNPADPPLPEVITGYR